MLEQWRHSNGFSFVTLTSGEEVINYVFMEFEDLLIVNCEYDLNIFKISYSVFHLSDGQDNNKVLSTPSTKWKNDSIGAFSISSSTRNLRSKVVKVEKMQELLTNSIKKIWRDFIFYFYLFMVFKFYFILKFWV